MSIFLDTGVFVAFEHAGDPRHQEAVQLVTSTAEGAWGEAFTSDYVFDEAVTLALVRTHRVDFVKRVGSLILGTGAVGRLVGMLHVSPRIFLQAWGRYPRLAEKGLSFTDCTSVELIRATGIDEIASFDRDFDGLVLRRSEADGPPSTRDEKG